MAQSSARPSLSTRQTNRTQTRKRASRHSHRGARRRLHLETFESRALLAAVSWIGGSGDWTDAANWSTGSVPGLDDYVVIDNPDAGLVITIPSGNQRVTGGQVLIFNS